MRTSIDLPEPVMSRVKDRLHKEGLTFRAFVISAIEEKLRKENAEPFILEDASVGKGGELVSTETINQAISELGEMDFKG